MQHVHNNHLTVESLQIIPSHSNESQVVRLIADRVLLILELPYPFSPPCCASGSTSCLTDLLHTPPLLHNRLWLWIHLLLEVE